MSTFLINIIAKSNLAEVLAIDDAAIDANNAKLKLNNDLLAVNSKTSKKTVVTKKATTGAFQQEIGAIERETAALKRHVSSWIAVGNAQDRVGYNFYGLSFRIGMWFVPALALMVTSMIPVIMSLLAMASAAILAGGALAAFLAIGAILYSRSANKNRTDNGYGGARRPYSTGGTTTSIWTTLFNPVYKVLDSPKLKGAVDNAKLFLQATIYGLAEGIGRFLKAVDPGMMAMLETMFLDWLPNGLESLAKWGSQLVKAIGAGSIDRLNRFISWVAGGIMGISQWLNESGGWNQLDTLTGTLADICSVLLELGKSVLPILNSALALIWPFPLKPILEVIKEICETISNNPTIMKYIRYLIIISAIILVIIGLILLVHSEVLGLIIAIVFVGMLLIVLRDLITDIVKTALSLGKYLLDEMILWFAKAVNFVLGQHIDTSEYDNLSFKAALAGEYAPDNWKQWDANQEQEKADVQNFTKDLKNNTLDVFFHSDDAKITDVIVNDVNGSKGDYNAINSNLAARRTVNF